MVRSSALVLLFAASAGLSRVTNAQSGWTVFEETTITSKISGSIRHGHVFTTASRNLYEVTDYIYLYEYLYSPKVIVLRQGPLYRLVIEGIDDPIYCRKLNDGPSEAADTTGLTAPLIRSRAATYIESTITSDFSGLNPGNIYKLANGQIWEQTDPWIWVWIWVMPKVQIYNSGGVFKMKVENIDHAVTVTRLK